MENKSHALAAGTFLLLLLALLVALAVWLTRDTRQLRVFELTSADPVTGLQPQASVRFKGVAVGKVTHIGLDPQAGGQVLIRIAIDEQAPITRSTFATLGFQGVTGLAFVQLDDSGESKVMIDYNQQPLPRIPLRPGLIAKLSDRGSSILLQLEETTRRVNLLLAPANQQSLLTALASLDQAAASIKQLSAEASQLLPQLAQQASTTLNTVKDSSLRVGASADEARQSARAFRTVTERMNAKDGTLDQLAVGAATLVATGQRLNSTTLPRVNRVAEDASRSARQLNRTADMVSDNPQSLLFGTAPITPGPGEPGFSASPGKP
ncbi:MAG: MlaD family protein [Rhodoferax sp.]|uniref:MlaD family protein n=1 Tax=Rhodoferax sp. TaxID=50421 RepID=UPI002601BFB5|nr:MlaD family protein [Rhodoferax sp.]MDD5332913.1 MlaD family protein [Rhodoferax sp.]